MAKNKVVFGDTVIMDITDTTAEAQDVAQGKDFYGADGVKRSGTGNYMNKVSFPTADDILVTDANGQAIDSGVKVSDKQDTLESGTNIKTINGETLLGSGNIDIKGDVRVDISDSQVSYSASIGSRTDGTVITFNEAKSDGRVSGYLYTDTPFELAKQGELEGLQSQIDSLGEPFRVKQWGSNTLNVEIPTCTEDISNTAIPKMVFSIDNVEGADYQIVGMIAYEVFDAASNGNRINCWPVCQFTGNGQKELSVRWMCGGTTRKTARRINAWVLLKHR